MNCFLQVSVFCLEGLISEFDLDVWIYHLKADSIISKETITPTNLKDIKKFTMLWREGFKMCFTNDELSKTTTKESEVSDYSDDDDDEAEQKKKQKKEEERKELEKFNDSLYRTVQMDDDLNTQLDALKAAWKSHVRVDEWKNADSLLLKSQSGFTFNYPNFELSYFWADHIRFLGPSWVTNTVLLENKHMQLRNLSRLTNLKNVEQDSMDLDSLIQTSVLRGEQEGLERCKSHIADYSTYGSRKTSLETPWGVATAAHSGIYYHSRRIGLNEYFLLQACVDLDEVKLNATDIFYGKIVDIFSVGEKILRVQSQSTLTEPPAGLSAMECPVLVPDKTFLVKLEHIKIIKFIMVLPHPRGQVFLHNIWVKKEIGENTDVEDVEDVDDKESEDDEDDEDEEEW